MRAVAPQTSSPGQRVAQRQHAGSAGSATSARSRSAHGHVHAGAPPRRRSAPAASGPSSRATNGRMMKPELHRADVVELADHPQGRAGDADLLLGLAQRGVAGRRGRPGRSRRPGARSDPGATASRRCAWSAAGGARRRGRRAPRGPPPADRGRQSPGARRPRSAPSSMRPMSAAAGRRAGGGGGLSVVGPTGASVRAGCRDAAAPFCNSGRDDRLRPQTTSSSAGSCAGWSPPATPPPASPAGRPSGCAPSSPPTGAAATWSRSRARPSSASPASSRPRPTSGAPARPRRRACCGRRVEVLVDSDALRELARGRRAACSRSAASRPRWRARSRSWPRGRSSSRRGATTHCARVASLPGARRGRRAAGAAGRAPTRVSCAPPSPLVARAGDADPERRRGAARGGGGGRRAGAAERLADRLAALDARVRGRRRADDRRPPRPPAPRGSRERLRHRGVLPPRPGHRSTRRARSRGARRRGRRLPAARAVRRRRGGRVRLPGRVGRREDAEGFGARPATRAELAALAARASARSPA